MGSEPRHGRNKGGQRAWYADPHRFSVTAAAPPIRRRSRRPNFAVMAWKDRSRQARSERLAAFAAAPLATFWSWMDGHGRPSDPT